METMFNQYVLAQRNVKDTYTHLDFEGVVHSCEDDDGLSKREALEIKG